ncbi:MAG: hypothetical protein D6708_15065, partial [Candidatus Dadabacteria bacterium]
MAVDHYVVGAVIQEVDASGNVLQESTPTDENGVFTFENPVTLGSTLRSKADARGTHNNLPYPGVLKRNVDTTAGRLVVSPLTTALANGMQPAALLAALEDAGITGLTEADLTRDPVAAFEGKDEASITDDDLKLERATQAVNAFFRALGNYDAGPEAFGQNAALLQKTAAAANQLFSKARLDALKAANGEKAVEGVPLTVDQLISSSIRIMDEIADDPDDDARTATLLTEQVQADLALHYYAQGNLENEAVAAAVATGALPPVVAAGTFVVDDDGSVDPDRDADGVADPDDAFPTDPAEWVDTDDDGIGNNADTDDDNDTFADADDAFPTDPLEWMDTDGDGTGNNADTDDDNDGVADADDAFPTDPAAAVDTDGDGMPDEFLASATDDQKAASALTEDPDDDNDGALDSADAFPLDPTENLDTDGDGIGDNADTDDDN